MAGCVARAPRRARQTARYRGTSLNVKRMAGCVARAARGARQAAHPPQTPRRPPPVPTNLPEQLLHRNVQRFRGGFVFMAHRLCVSLNSRLESNQAAHPPQTPRRSPPVTIRPERFRGGLVLKAHRLLYHSTLGLRATKKKKVSIRPGSLELKYGNVG